MSKKNKRNQQWYLKQVQKLLVEIHELSPEHGEVFLRLKKKAKRYVEKAREFEKAPRN